MSNGSSVTAEWPSQGLRSEHEDSAISKAVDGKHPRKQPKQAASTSPGAPGHPADAVHEVGLQNGHAGDPLLGSSCGALRTGCQSGCMTSACCYWMNHVQSRHAYEYMQLRTNRKLAVLLHWSLYFCPPHVQSARVVGPGFSFSILTAVDQVVMTQAAPVMALLSQVLLTLLRTWMS